MNEEPDVEYAVDASELPEAERDAVRGRVVVDA